MQMSLGNVAGPGPAYRAVLTNDDYGVVVLAGVKDQKIALAEGTWKVVNYTLDATAASGGGRTAIEATFGNRPPTVTVKKGRPPGCRSGAHFRAVVTAARAEKARSRSRCQSSDRPASSARASP